MTKKRTAGLICLIACMVMIFVFSSQNADISGNLSEGITYKIASLTVKDFETFSYEKQKEIVEGMHFYIRKAAHFSEYALLGIIAFLNSTLYFKKTRTRFFTTLPFCLLYAATDEMHQLFTDGRCGSPVDVMIDFSGAVTGTISIFIVLTVVNAVKKKHDRSPA
ncbi:MAG: VanZ family protein [Oscillospiraceae bacterium]|nr:VanZ family protein [Oscillospiraceae bacterium]MBR6924000.1 VanZ family protein [Oscillospiraceae bacterium]